MRGIKQGTVTVLLLGCLICCSSVAYAEGDSLVTSLGLKEEYNDNIFLTDEDEIDDFITSVSPGIEFRRRYERVSASLKGLLDLTTYSDNSDLSEVDQLYTGDFRYLLTQRLSFSGEASFKRDSRPDRDIDETGLTFGTETRKRQNYSAGIGYSLTEKTGMNIRYAHGREDFDDPEFTDYKSHAVDAGFNHNLSSWISSTTGRLNLGYTRLDYLTTDIDYYRLTIGAERQWTEIYSYYFDVGVRSIHSEFNALGEKDDSMGGVVKLGMRYKGELTYGDAFFSHDVAAASGRTGTTERTSFVFALQRRLSEKFTASLNGGYFLNKSDRGELAENDIDKETWKITPLLAYKISRYFTLEGSYTYTHIKDKAESEDRDRNLVFARLVLQYPFFE